MMVSPYGIKTFLKAFPMGIVFPGTLGLLSLRLALQNKLSLDFKLLHEETDAWP